MSFWNKVLEDANQLFDVLLNFHAMRDLTLLKKETDYDYEFYSIVFPLLVWVLFSFLKSISHLIYPVKPEPRGGGDSIFVNELLINVL